MCIRDSQSIAHTAAVCSVGRAGPFRAAGKARAPHFPRQKGAGLQPPAEARGKKAPRTAHMHFARLAYAAFCRGLNAHARAQRSQCAERKRHGGRCV